MPPTSTSTPTEFRRALAALPVDDRTLLRCVVVHRVSYAACARVFGVTREEVARRVLRARRRLRQLMT